MRRHLFTIALALVLAAAAGLRAGDNAAADAPAPPRALSLQEQLAAARRQLQASQALADGLRTELAMQGRRLEELQSAPDPAAGRLAALQSANAALAAEIETLQSQLLLAVARPPDPPAPPPPAAPASNRWALRISYDAAHAFLVLHADGNSVSGAAAESGAGDSLVTSTAVIAANAVQFRLLHDRARERVYSATLSVSLAADAPRAKLAENKALIAEYLHAFIPALKDADAVLAATAQLAGLDESRRLVFLVDDCKLTLWNDKTGVYTFRIESSHEE